MLFVLIISTKIGLLTDIQYADVDDGKSYDQKRHRYYRNSLNLVKEAITNWKTNYDIKFLIQLGDLIDGKAKPINESMKSLETVISEMKNLFTDESKQEILHIWGNHVILCCYHACIGINKMIIIYI